MQVFFIIEHIMQCKKSNSWHDLGVHYGPFFLEYQGKGLNASGCFLNNYFLYWIEIFHEHSLSLNLLGRVSFN